MLLANYASDDESGSDTEAPQPGPSRPIVPVPVAKPKTNSTGVTAPPKNTTTTAAGPSKSKRKGPVKITLDLPKSSVPGAGSGTADGGGENDDEENAGEGTGSRGAAGEGDDDEGGGRGAKRAKLGMKGGKGSSTLLGMLPPPKRKVAIGTKTTLAVNKSMAKPVAPKPLASLPAPEGYEDDAAEDDQESSGDTGRSGLLLPASVKRGQVKATKREEKAVELDLFGLAAPSSSTSSNTTGTTSLPPLNTISSAPPIAEFTPPPPTANDPYPGYYQLPSGSWAAYDPEYYHSFFPSGTDAQAGQAEKGDDGRIGRHWEEFDSKGADMVEIDVASGLEESRREAERRERLVKPKLAGDDYEYKVIGQTKGLAQERHQLSSLLNTAFSQRDELEQRISQNKKNMRMAGTKYGF